MKAESEKAVAVAEGEMPRGGGNADAVKDAGEKILGYFVKYAGETFKAVLINESGEKLEADAVKDAGDEIVGYIVKYAGESLKAELVDKSGEKLVGDAVKDAGDEIQGYVVKSAGETLEAELVNRSGEKLQADNGETRKADVGEKSTDPIKGKADSSGNIKAEPAKICNNADAPETPKANSIEPAKICNNADAPETPKANSIEGDCADAETVKNIDREEGDASKEKGGDESQEEGGDEPEEKEEGDESKEKEEDDGSEEQDGGDESEEEEDGDESEDEGGQTSRCLRWSLISRALLSSRGIQIGGEFRARAEAVGIAMQAHSQLVNEPPYSMALNNLRKTINTLLNSPVTLA
ncbi:hypothetical protein TRIUR3_29853 [Triticum urartu]|uniref:Uncharacterized protein n=1 Tax=Triticum urartu TaxID=4572 RepID=M7ZQ97_TRIUA|nr:hypothetical protein TRIUR3_29853 [Triticum urartu]